MSQLAPDQPRLTDASAAASLVDVPAGTIRRWASEGLLPRHGSDARGRTLYDLRQVAELAAIMVGKRRRNAQRPDAGQRSATQ